MTKRFNQGFTLIELLVVIAIIGILSSVVLASLNTARGKGADAAAKSNLNNIRAQAEIFYDTNGNTYTGVCASGTGTIYAGVNAAAATEGYTWNGTNAINYACNTNGTAWAAWVKLAKGPNPTQLYCVDSTGTSKIQTTDPSAATLTACW